MRRHRVAWYPLFAGGCLGIALGFWRAVLVAAAIYLIAIYEVQREKVNR